MTQFKKTVELYGMPIAPIVVGHPAAIPQKGRVFHTSPVVALHECTQKRVHFETRDAHYYLSVPPFAAAAQPSFLKVAA